jgi:16S rRNA (uracil1498-N3)-methyltransferase
VTSVEDHPPAEPVHLLVPIADRDRMLWLAEKATELGVTSWRPVMWRRSRSVSPRGEGASFQAKVRARMISAMLQSGSAWLPALYPDATIDSAILAAPEGSRLVLDGTGAPVLHAAENLAAPVTLAIGPEGGFELDELDRIRDGGFTAVSLGHSILRFETAGVAAAAVARALLASRVAHAPASAGGDSHLED